MTKEETFEKIKKAIINIGGKDYLKFKKAKKKHAFFPDVIKSGA